MDAEDISRPGKSSLLEVPMSIHLKHSPLMNGLKQGYDALRGKKRSPSALWLRPSGGNLERMKQVAAKSLSQGHDYVEFMLHSSEFMPGGSPTFKNEQDIEGLYRDVEQLFSWLSERTVGLTLAEYYQRKVN